MKINILSGAALATTAVALALGGTVVPPAAAEKSASVHCLGINSCKGKSACKSASNSCKGQNSCKGEGWLPEKSKNACEEKGGTVG
jgi:hypothetical protein